MDKLCRRSLRQAVSEFISRRVVAMCNTEKTVNTTRFISRLNEGSFHIFFSSVCCNPTYISAFSSLEGGVVECK